MLAATVVPLVVGPGLEVATELNSRHRPSLNTLLPISFQDHCSSLLLEA